MVMYVRIHARAFWLLVQYERLLSELYKLPLATTESSVFVCWCARETDKIELVSNGCGYG